MTRANVVSVILLGMLGAFGALLYIQHEGDLAPAHAETVPVSAKPAEAPPKPAAAPLVRTMRTIALGWEWLAPGVIANDGGTPGTASGYKAAGLDASFGNASTMDELESALAKGGEAGGADLAIVPLASYVASYERLRALAPEVVFVVGWSRGREALFGADPRALAKLPASGPVKLAAAPGAPETFLALFLLDLAGVPASRVELGPDRATLTAVFRTAKQKPPGKLLVTSADTPTLMPVVAIAPHGFVQAHGAQLEAWARVWLAGVARLTTDVPAGGRQVAALAGAPPVVGIIEALGQIEFASLRENAAAVGLSGRGALTLDEIFRHAWRIWREAGQLSTPPPEVVPLHPAVIAALVRADPGAGTEAPRRAAPGDATKRPEVLLVVQAPANANKLDAEAFVTRIGFLAGVFDRLPLRIGVRDDAKTAQLLADMARDRFGLRATQLSAGKRPPAGSLGAVEVLSAL